MFMSVSNNNAKMLQLRVQSAADLATLGPFQQLETVLLLFLIANIVGPSRNFKVTGRGLCAISRLVVVSDRKSHITIQHKSRCSQHDSREQARPRPVGHSSKNQSEISSPMLHTG